MASRKVQIIPLCATTRVARPKVQIYTHTQNKKGVFFSIFGVFVVVLHRKNRKMPDMRPEMQRLAASAIIPALLVFALYALLKALETGMGWDFTSWGVRPLEWRGVAGIVLHPLVHADWEHLAANTLPLFFLSWCLFYFYRGIAPAILACVWTGSGLLTFIIDRPVGMARGSQWPHLWAGVLSVFQRTAAQACTVGGVIAAGDIPLRQPGMEHVSRLCRGWHVVGGAPGRSGDRHGMCLCFQKPGTATPPTFCRRGRGG